jgi:hypothetical protein
VTAVPSGPNWTPPPHYTNLIFFKLRHYVEVNDQLHAPATLTSEKHGWFQEIVWTR